VGEFPFSRQKSKKKKYREKYRDAHAKNKNFHKSLAAMPPAKKAKPEVAAWSPGHQAHSGRLSPPPVLDAQVAACSSSPEHDEDVSATDPGVTVVTDSMIEEEERCASHGGPRRARRLARCPLCGAARGPIVC